MSILAWTIAGAQTFYEMSFRLPAPVNLPCEALVYHAYDGRGFARIRWKDARQQQTVLVDFEPNLNIMPEWASTEPGMFDKIELQQIRAIRGRVSAALDDLPIFVMQPGYRDPSPHLPTGYTAYRQWQDTLLDRSTLLKYFTQNELGSRMRFGPASLFEARTRNLPVLHTLLLIDESDKSIGKTCALDRISVNQFYQTVARTLHLRYQPRLLNNKDFSKTALQAELAALRPGRDDIVVFYYSGHGFRYRNDESRLFPEMKLLQKEQVRKRELRENSMNTEDVFNLLRARNPRLLFVISDCCNAYVEMNRYEDTSDIRKMMLPDRRGWKKAVLSNLFLTTKGAYLISSAKKGQLAGSHMSMGGFFTYSLYRIYLFSGLARRVSWFQNWDQVFAAADRYATQKALEFSCDDPACMNLRSGKDCPKITCKQHMELKRVK